LKHSVLLGFFTGLLVLIYINQGSQTKSPSPNTPEASDHAVPLANDPPEAQGVSEVASASFAPAPTEAAPSQELAQEIEKVKTSLPSLGELRELPDDEVHGAPAKIIEAGAALGELDEYLEKRPEEFASASRFFSDCAAGETLPGSIRAMCLHSLRNHPTQWAPGVSAKLERLPSDVVELEAQL